MYKLNYTPTAMGSTKVKKDYIWGHAKKIRFNTTRLDYSYFLCLTTENLSSRSNVSDIPEGPHLKSPPMY
jgi:hypothetical protein